MASANAALAVTLPQWQQYSRCGIKCIPCGNYLYGNHEETPRHKARLAAWLELQRPGLQCFVAHAQLRQRQTRGYPVPEKSHLAWAPRTSYILYIKQSSCGSKVPHDEDNVAAERFLKCLLCNRFCDEDGSHDGTVDQQYGCKQHLRLGEDSVSGGAVALRKCLKNYSRHYSYWEAEIAAKREPLEKKKIRSSRHRTASRTNHNWTQAKKRQKTWRHLGNGILLVLLRSLLAFLRLNFHEGAGVQRAHQQWRAGRRAMGSGTPRWPRLKLKVRRCCRGNLRRRVIGVPWTARATTLPWRRCCRGNLRRRVIGVSWTARATTLRTLELPF